MKHRIAAIAIALLFATAAGCGSGGSCDLPTNWSTANSGGLCQVDFFDPMESVFCAENANGEYDCACGPIANNPLEFTSADFCDLEAEDRACAAIEACGFQL